MRSLVALAFFYIGAFVVVQTLRQWRRLGHSPIASLTRAHTTRIRQLVEAAVGLGLAAWVSFFLLYLADPDWWRRLPHVAGGRGWLDGIGLTLLLAAGAQLTAGNLTMGLSWRMGIVDDAQPLVRHGIYGRVRHPINGAMMLYLAAAAALMPNVVTLPAMACAILALLAETALEEDYWLEKQPEEYGKMLAETRKFWPLP